MRTPVRGRARDVWTVAAANQEFVWQKHVLMVTQQLFQSWRDDKMMSYSLQHRTHLQQTLSPRS
eukprot:26584-Eustigmatos_ZCMA.PRE.1